MDDHNHQVGDNDNLEGPDYHDDYTCTNDNHHVGNDYNLEAKDYHYGSNLENDLENINICLRFGRRR